MEKPNAADFKQAQNLQMLTERDLAMEVSDARVEKQASFNRQRQWEKPTSGLGHPRATFWPDTPTTAARVW
jgi:hypothetical protein